MDTSSYSPSKLFTTTCPTPSGLSESSITYTSANLSWTPIKDIRSYSLQFRVSGSTNWETINDLNSSSYVFTNLTPNTIYEWRVYVVCSNVDKSNNSVSKFFTTLCPISSNLSVSNITFKSANLSWSSITGVNGYIFRYKNVDSLSWNVIDGLTLNSYTLDNLNSGFTYEWQVKTKCGTSNSDTSFYSESKTFTTICSPPSILNQSNIRYNGVTLSWNSIPNIVAYNLRYRAGGSWTNVITTSNSYLINNLNPNTTYEWQVQTKCGNVDSSEFSSSRFFTTSLCQYPAGLTQNSITENSAKVSWMPISGVYGYNLQYKISTDPFWTTIPNLVSTSYSITGLNSGTAYQWRVQTKCTIDSSSSYSPPITFSTSCSQVPYNLNASDITYNSVKLGWAPIPGTQGYNLKYKKSNSLEWVTIENILENQYSFKNLLPGLTYEWKVQSVCNSGGALFSGSSFFITKRCETPSSIVITNITNSSATINWNVSENSDSYLIRYRVVGTNNWITSGDNPTTPTYTLFGLGSNTNYEIQIRSNCGTINSTFSAIIKFKTKP